MDTFAEPAVIAVWERVDEFEPETARIFTGDEYAEWAETNHLADAFPWPVRFYGLNATGVLTELDYHVHVSPYDEDDYAIVTHTWKRRTAGIPLSKWADDNNVPRRTAYNRAHNGTLTVPFHRTATGRLLVFADAGNGHRTIYTTGIARRDGRA